MGLDLSAEYVRLAQRRTAQAGLRFGPHRANKDRLSQQPSEQHEQQTEIDQEAVCFCTD
jgi:hypothetical protein